MEKELEFTEQRESSDSLLVSNGQVEIAKSNSRVNP